jgi:hypothetical protein
MLDREAEAAAMLGMSEDDFAAIKSTRLAWKDSTYPNETVVSARRHPWTIHFR